MSYTILQKAADNVVLHKSGNLFLFIFQCWIHPGAISHSNHTKCENCWSILQITDYQLSLCDFIWHTMTTVETSDRKLVIKGTEVNQTIPPR